MGGSKKVQPGPYDKALAQVYREQFAEWENTWRPVEREMLSEYKALELDRPGTLDEAGRLAQQGFNTSQGVATRNLARYGLGRDADQARVRQRKDGTSKMLTIANARNLARRGNADMRMQAAQQISGIGIGVMGKAVQGMATAAQGERQRMMMNAQADNARRAEYVKLGSMVLGAATGGLGAGMMAGGMAASQGAMVGASMGGAVGGAFG